MKTKTIISATMLVLAFQNCGGMKSEVFSAENFVIQDLSQQCQAKTHEISAQVQGQILMLDLISRTEDPAVAWAVQDSSGAVISSSNNYSTEPFAANLNYTTSCAVRITAYYVECGQQKTLQKTQQVQTCYPPGGGNPPGAPPTTIPAPPTTLPPPPTPTTVPPTPTTLPAPAPISGIGPEIVSGCQAQHTTQITNWDAIYMRWPGYGRRPRMIIPSGTTVTLKFTTHAHAGLLNPLTDPGYGTISGGEFPGDGDGSMLMTISSTPGCVDVTKLNPRCVSNSVYPSVGYQEGGSATGFSCPLEFGKTYYFNMTFGSASSPSGPLVPFCESGVCGKDVIIQIQ